MKNKYFNNGIYKVEVKNSDENPSLGIIIDVFNEKTGDLIDTYTYWNDDLSEEV